MGPDLGLDVGIGGGSGERRRQSVQDIVGGLGRCREPYHVE